MDRRWRQFGPSLYAPACEARVKGGPCSHPLSDEAEEAKVTRRCHLGGSAGHLLAIDTGLRREELFALTGPRSTTPAAW